MLIGVDVRSLSEPITGIGRYTLSLLEEMVLDKSHEWVLYSYRPLLHGQWNRSNVTVRTWNFPKWVRGLYTPWSQLILPFWLRQDNIDLFWSPAHRLPICLSKSIARVVTIHDLVWRHSPETMRPFGRLLDTYLMPRAVDLADRVIAVSNSTAKDLINEVPEAIKKTSVIYEGNSLLLNKSNAVKHIDEGYILFVGTLEPRKNLSRLLEAYSMLSSTLRKKHTLVIVGGRGWGNENIHSIIKDYDLRNNVKIMGYLSDEELASVFREAYLFIMPSLYEGFGLPLLEAMNAGIAVLASNTSSMPEVVGDAGIFFDPNSAQSIKSSLETVILNPNLRKSLSRKGIERAKEFSWHKTSKETLKLFESAMFSRSDLLD